MYTILGIASIGLFNKYMEIILATFFILFIYMLKKKRKVVIPTIKNFYIIILFCLSYTVISVINQNFSSIICVCPIITYYSGLILGNLCDNDEKYISKCIISIAMGFFLHAMLNYSINIGNTNRNTIDFWTRSSLSATLQGCFLTMILSMSFYNIFCVKSKAKKIFLIICTILSLSYITMIATRTTIIIFIVVTIIEIYIYMILNKKTKNRMKLIWMIILIIIIALFLYNRYNFEIKTLIEETNLGIRLNLNNGTQKSDEKRLESQILGFISIINNPFGTKSKIGNLTYAHNMWLDLGKDVGIIPFAFLVIYTINSFASLVYIIKSNKISINYKILLSSIYLGVNLNFAVEPILQGMPFYFFMFVLITGLIDAQVFYLKSNENVKNYRRGELLNENTLDS